MKLFDQILAQESIKNSFHVSLPLKSGREYTCLLPYAFFEIGPPKIERVIYLPNFTAIQQSSKSSNTSIQLKSSST
jgi:hypothetical protein